MPRPEEVLDGSAIGIQTMVHHRSGDSVGRNVAPFIYGPNFGFQELTISVSSYVGQSAEFRLVCDPKYPPDYGTARPPLRCRPPEEVTNMPGTTYDLNWAFGNWQLPPGRVKVSVRVQLGLTDKTGSDSDSENLFEAFGGIPHAHLLPS